MDFKKPKIVVLGKSGFVGSALWAEFKAKGYETIGLSSKDFDMAKSENVERFSEILDENAILILAARAHAGNRFENFSNDIEIAKNTALALVGRSIRKCLYFSTISVYNDEKTNLNITEETPVSPTTPYGIAKYAGESILSVIIREQGIPLLIFRPCKIYGPKDPSRAYGPTGFVEAALSGEKIALWGDGTELRDHLFIDDLVRVAVRMSLGDETGIYNLASGASNSYKEIVDTLQRMVDIRMEIVFRKRTRPKIDQIISVKKLREALPDFRFTSMADGMRMTFDAFLAPNLERKMIWRKST